MPQPVRCPYRVAFAPPPAEGHWLAHIAFGRAAGGGDDPRLVTVPLPVLGGPAEECWLSETPVTTGWQDGIGYAHNDQVLFGQLHLAEDELARLGLDRAVFQVYARIEHLLHSRGHPYWLRMWNFLADINAGEGDAERYRQFSTGRYKALALKAGFEAALPAATAIGMPDGGLVIYFLGSRHPGVQVENPRQVSAFAYPRQYGPKSPSFSRATRVDWSDGAELLVSGTASVVGHATQHEGDALAQLRETFLNLESLLGAAGGGLAPEHFKLYVRDDEGLQALQALARAQYPDAVLTLLRGDICRLDLAVEIEGVYAARRA